MGIESGMVFRAMNHSSNLGGIVFGGAGLHFETHNDPGSHVHLIWRNALEDVKSFAANGGGRVRLIGNTMHHFGDNTFEVHRPKTNGPEVRAYNAAQRKFWAANGIAAFESYRLTVNAPTADGEHVFSRSNVIMAQLLLNFIVALLREAAKEPPPPRRRICRNCGTPARVSRMACTLPSFKRGWPRRVAGCRHGFAVSVGGVGWWNGGRALSVEGRTKLRGSPL